MPEESAPTLEPKPPATAAQPAVELEENPRAFTLWQRAQILVASVVGYLAVLLVGRTLRFEVFGWENWEAARKVGKGLIYTCLAPRDLRRHLVLAEARHRGDDQPEF